MGTYTGLGAQNEDGEDELREHANNDGVPLDELAVPRRGPEDEEEDDQAEARDRTVSARVVGRLLRDKGADQDDGECSDGGENRAEALGDVTDGALDDVLPDECDGHHEVVRGDIEGDEAHHDEEPEEEWDEPAVVVAVEDEACDPPSGVVSIYLAVHC